MLTINNSLRKREVPPTRNIKRKQESLLAVLKIVLSLKKLRRRIRTRRRRNLLHLHRLKIRINRILLTRTAHPVRTKKIRKRRVIVENHLLLKKGSTKKIKSKNHNRKSKSKHSLVWNKLRRSLKKKKLKTLSD
jgi:hypothetical protein